MHIQPIDEHTYFLEDLHTTWPPCYELPQRSAWLAMAGKQPKMSPPPKESEVEVSFKPAKETKKIPLDPEHPERHAVIGANLDSK